MPDQLEAFKLAERTGIRNRTMFAVLVIASLVGILSSLILYPYTIYSEGVAAGSEADSCRWRRYIQLFVFVVSESETHGLAGNLCARLSLRCECGHHFSAFTFCVVSVASSGLCYRCRSGDNGRDMVSPCFWRWSQSG